MNIQKNILQNKNNILYLNKLNPWTIKSINIPFKSNKNCVGNGEDKLAKELDIISSPGGQNNTVDLLDKILGLGEISVKDMTNDDCILGTEGCEHMRKIFRKIINPFVSWCEKYKLECELANNFYNYINKIYGKNKLTILEGIDRYELSKTNLTELNNILENIKKTQINSSIEYTSLNSEYINDIIINLKNKTLQEHLNDSVRLEAINKTLIIVYETKGYIIIKNDNIKKITCPRITRGAPRINYDL